MYTYSQWIIAASSRGPYGHRSYPFTHTRTYTHTYTHTHTQPSNLRVVLYMSVHICLHIPLPKANFHGRLCYECEIWRKSAN